MRDLTVALAAPLALALALGPAGCGHVEEEWQVKLHEIAALNAKLARATQDRKKLEDEGSRAQDDLAQAKAELATVARTSEPSRPPPELSRLGERQRTEVEAMRARIASLKPKLEPVFRSGGGVTLRRNQLTLLLPAPLLFEGKEGELSARGRDTLRAIAEAIAADPVLATRLFEVVGHADKGKREDTAYARSSARAASAREFLVSKRGGMPASRWSWAGRGSIDPISEDDTPVGHAQNDRLEIVLVPDPAELTDMSQVSP